MSVEEKLRTTSTLVTGAAVGFLLSCWVTRDHRLLQLGIIALLISLLLKAYSNKRTPRGEQL